MLLGLVAVCVQIWLIVLFVRLSSNVGAILRLLQRQCAAPVAPAVALKDVRLAVLLGNQEEVYTKIISKLYDDLSTAELERALHRPPTVDAESAIKNASNLCSVLGMPLPSELATPEAFKQFSK